MRDLPLDRAQGQSDALLGFKFLPDDIGVAGMPAKPLRHPLLVPSQCPRPTPAAIRNPAALRQVPADRHVAAPQLTRDPTHAPPLRLQPQHRRHLVRRLHPLPPPQPPPPSRLHRFVHPQTLLLDRGGPVLNVVRGPVLSVARQPPYAAIL